MREKDLLDLLFCLFKQQWKCKWARVHLQSMHLVTFESTFKKFILVWYYGCISYSWCYYILDIEDFLCLGFVTQNKNERSEKNNKICKPLLCTTFALYHKGRYTDVTVIDDSYFYVFV